jgi:guanosine-3',5'-bis(diphosphate) 3'-pyrophosphohydrolase
LLQYYCRVIESSFIGLALQKWQSAHLILNGDCSMTKISDLQLLTNAMAFAADKHKDHRRKDENSSPYINHPIALVNLLVNEGGITDPETLSAALLHDTVEDTDTTKTELVEAFGEAIAGIVMEVTDDRSLPKAERKRAQVAHAPHLSVKAKAVKLADKTCNLRDVSENPPHDWSLERRQQYFDWGREVIDGLRGDWPELEIVFDQQYQRKPSACSGAADQL